MKTIILYTSKYGTTKECAEYLQTKIKDSVIHKLDDFKGTLNTYDRILIGSPIYSGKFPKVVTEFLTENVNLLQTKNHTIFFCGMSEENFEKAKAKSIPAILRQDSNIVPVGGAYKLESIGSLNRFLLRLTGVKESVNKINYKALDKIALVK